MKSSVTVSLVPEAKGGPFIFWNGLEDACQKAAKLGFDAIEVFSPGPESLDASKIRPLLAAHNLQLAALGTGGGWIRHKLTLTHTDARVRGRACDFIKAMIDRACQFRAAVIVGSLQGRWENPVSREQALAWLAEGFRGLQTHASQAGIPLFYEFLNRYETNLINRLPDAIAFLKNNQLSGVKVLADLFHMNIEESSISEAIRASGDWIGHVHFVDSNRRAAGFGHIDFASVISALRSISYQGYLSAEATAYPDSESAAAQTIKAFKSLVSG
jgi:sugar phosphate isomerase/epimerase